MMTTAPDPGLTDLIAAHRLKQSYWNWWGCTACDWRTKGTYGSEPTIETATEHAKHVVEQHTNGRTAELEAELAEYHAEERRELESARNRARDDVRCPSCNLRYGERDQYGCIEPARAHDYDADELRAALEGKS